MLGPTVYYKRVGTVISEILKYSSLHLSFFICCCSGCTCADIKTFTASFELNRAAYLRKGIFMLFLVNKTKQIPTLQQAFQTCFKTRTTRSTHAVRTSVSGTPQQVAVRSLSKHINLNQYSVANVQ